MSIFVWIGVVLASIAAVAVALALLFVLSVVVWACVRVLRDDIGIDIGEDE